MVKTGFLNEALNLDHLSFSYGNTGLKVLNNVSIKVNVGERFGIFGPNGAGKTTLLSLITGIINHNNGTIKIFGNELPGNKNQINGLFGYIPQDFAFYEELTSKENLEYFGALYGIDTHQLKSRIPHLLRIFGLEEVANNSVKTFSGGMKRRLNIAIGVLHQPRLLILDEPTVGVDAHSRNAIIQYLKQLNETGTTLIYTSHQLKEAEELCTRIALLNDGEIISENTLPELLIANQCNTLEEVFIKLTGNDYRD